MRHSLVLLAMACSTNGCGGTPDDARENTDVTRQEIVRATSLQGPAQVVLVHWPRYDGRTELCSGVYVAPRVVLTAAHCLRDDLIPGNGLVYLGQDYATDVVQLGQLPAPGNASTWARIENSERHPDWDPTLHHPDLGVVYLDRNLPFAPLPMATFHLDDRWVGELAWIAGWGAEQALSDDLSMVAGIGVERTGKVRIMGSPSVGDFHPDDPNPGLLEPEIRAHLLKTDGRAPLSNLCAGDSGGPLLLRWGHLELVAGIASWTGVGCEDYGLYSRIDPFLPFIQHSFERAGHLPVRPELACITEGEAGQFTAYFGYDNQNALSIEIPYGWLNGFPGDHDHQRPVNFRPGHHPWAFRAHFSGAERLAWWLMPPVGPFTLVHADQNSPRCAQANTHGIVEACEASARAGCGQSFMECTDRAWGELEFLGAYGFPCTAEFEGIERCMAGLDASSFICSGSEPIPSPEFCVEEMMGYLGCLGL